MGRRSRWTKGHAPFCGLLVPLFGRPLGKVLLQLIVILVELHGLHRVSTSISRPPCKETALTQDTAKFMMKPEKARRTMLGSLDDTLWMRAQMSANRRM